MKERPILFSGAMVRAILAGEKTQTRRIVKPQPVPYAEFNNSLAFVGPTICQPGYLAIGVDAVPGSIGLLKCPYGQPGDRLYVRESYFQFGHWEPVTGKLTKGGRQKWAFVPDSKDVIFDSSAVPGGTWRLGRHNVGFETPAWHKRLGRFMPRAASRITLEITGIRVERLQEINEDDARAEGVIIDRSAAESSGMWDAAHRRAYHILWNSINGPGSWDANPFVWVVEFKRITP